MNEIEKILKGREDDSSITLNSQWQFDKSRYEDILKGIRDYYSHFTDHGNSHSETILANIVKILTLDALKKFSSVDLWLLLEAVYSHDCGMYISIEEVKKLLETTKFIEYIREIKNNENHIYNRYTSFFTIEDKKILYERGKNYIPENEMGMRFLVASYKRSSHAESSKKFIEETHLLPKRLFELLGEIVYSHGYSHEKIEERLPIKQKGIGLEDCHPRFISYLLRMGDLLDLDNDRISPIIEKNLEKIIPSDSLIHSKKHKSIKYFRLDSERIEIEALIGRGDDVEKAYDVYEVTESWFNWIRKEYDYQLKVWEDVKPKEVNCKLPQLGKLDVKIEGNSVIKSRNKNTFSLDVENTFEILRGAGIYEEKEDALREVLQNAVDATLLRVFLEKEEEYREVESQEEKYKEELEKRKIKVNIDRVNKKITSEEEVKNNFWKVSIIDEGVGLDEEDFKYLIETASSSTNIEKKR